ncbi:hypothetical protein [Tenacibaculum sp. SDUM215027]|uniref:hypothetical protein n=1 Tax=Tenacibaculum sp. SDUM215027 TaxID=3422596 RepID=UPI003D316833
MRKVILSVALLLASGVFTSCTDVSEDNIQEKLEIQNTGGEEDQDPPKDPDEENEISIIQGHQSTGGENDHDPDEEDDEVLIKGTKESIYTGGEEDQDPDEEDEVPIKSGRDESIDTGGEEDPIEEDDDL